MSDRARNRTERPLLLVDVDGVLNPLGHRPPPGFFVQSIDGYEVAISDRHGRWLNELAESFELWWATTWEQSANNSVGTLLGLPELPVVRFAGERSGDTRKLEAVQGAVGDRSLAWIDDELFLDAYEWARNRAAPTLLVRPSSSVGMTLSHFEQICRFRDELER